MAGRVNTKFVVLLIAILLMAGGGVIAAWWVTAKTDPAEYIARADSFYRQGDYERAAQQYGRALKVDKNNLELILRYTDTVSKFQISDTKQARSLIDQMRNWWGRALNIDPTNEEAMTRLMEMFISLGREMNDTRVWERVYERTTSLLGSQPDNLLARKYRAIAQVERLNTLDLNQTERELTRQDIDFVLAQLPDDLETIYADAKWHLAEAARIKKTGIRFDDVESHRITAINILREASQKNPDNPEPLLQLTRTLQQADEEKDAREVVLQLESQADNYLDQPNTILGIVELMIQLFPEPSDQDADNTRWSQGLERAVALLAKSVEANPKALRLKLAYGRMLRLSQKSDEAYEIFDDIRQTTYKTDPLQALMVSQYRYVAAEQSATLLLVQAQNKSLEERKELLARVDDLIKELRDTSGDSGIVNLLSGRVAIERGQWVDAIEKLEVANTQFGGSHMETLVLAAEAHRKMGTSGAAAERLLTVIKAQPNYIPGRLRLVEIYIGTRQLDLARQQLEYCLQNEPGNKIARQLKVQLLMAEQKYSDAIDLLESIGAADDPALAQILIRVYYKADRKDEALALAGARFEAEPTNTSLLQMVLQLDPDNKQLYLDRAKQAGTTEQVLNLMASQFDSSIDTMALLTEQIDSTSQTPIQKHLNKYRLLVASNRVEDAEKELVAAETIDATHPLIVQIRFEEALQNEDYDTARNLAQVASKQNLDRVQGLVYRGRLELAEQRINLAVTSLKRASKLNSLDATVWRVLGDALMAQGDYASARDAYQEALRLKPDTAAVHRGMALAFNALGDFSSALLHFKQASDYATGNTNLLNTYLAYEREHGDSMKVLEYRRKQAKDNPKDIVNRRTLAVLLADIDKPIEAQQTLDAIVAEEGMNRANVLTQAQLKRAAGDLEGTRQTLIDYTSKLGDDAQSIDWLMAGRFMQQMGEVDTALAYYRASRKVEDPSIQEGTRQLADALFSLQRNEDAIELYRELMKNKNNDNRVGLRLAEALLRQNQIDEAEKTLDQAMQNESPSASSLMLRGMIARTRGRFQDSIGYFDKAAEMVPNNPTVYFERATSLLQIPGQEAQAITQLNRAININPAMIQARIKLVELYTSRQDFTLATTEARKLLEYAPEYNQVRHMLVRLYQAAGRTTLLRDLLKESREMFPDDPSWLTYQVQFDLQAKRIDSAIGFQKELVKLNATPKTVADLTQMLINHNKLRDALATLQAHEEHVQNQPIMLALRGHTKAKLSQAEEARQDFATAMEQCRSIQQVLIVANQMEQAWGKDQLLGELSKLELPAQSDWLELAKSQFEANKQLYSAAIARLEPISFIQGSPEQIMADRLRAICYYQQQIFEPSRAAYERILEVVPEDVASLNNLAYLLCEDLNLPEQALPLAEKANEIVESRPSSQGDPQLLDTLGWIYYRLKRYQEAERTLQMSLSIEPIAPAAYHLAMTMIQDGRLIEARNLLNQALDLAKSTNDQEILDLTTQRMAELETQ